MCADPEVPVYGSTGSSVHAQEVIAAFRELNHNVDVFAASPGNDSSRYYQLPVALNGPGDMREQYSFDLNQFYLKMFEGLGTFDLIYERHSMWSYAAMEQAHLKGIPSILEVHTPLIAELQEELVHRTLAEEVARRAFSNASCLVVASKQIQKYVETIRERKMPCCSCSEWSQPEPFSPWVASSSTKEPDTFVIGFLGNLRPCRGLAVLAEAFSILGDSELPLAALNCGGWAGTRFVRTTAPSNESSRCDNIYWSSSASGGARISGLYGCGCCALSP